MAILEPLSYKQQKFCEEYLLSFNAYRAALTAGYTDNTARKGDLLHVPKIQAYLKDAMNRSAARAELTHDMLLRELMKVAFCNMGNYYDDQGDPKRMHELTDDEKAAISYYQRADVTAADGHISGELFKIKLHNKMAAIDKLCRHTGFYKAKWEPAVWINPGETDEDRVFEAESAKIPAGPYTEEVQDELLEQTGLGDEPSADESIVNEGTVYLLEEAGDTDGFDLATIDAGLQQERPAVEVNPNSNEKAMPPLTPEGAGPALVRSFYGRDVIENILLFPPLPGSTELVN
jgi:hypothetical protein